MQAWDSALESNRAQAIGDIVNALVEPAPTPVLLVEFSHPDITYLTRRYELEPHFIGRMLGWFVESVVLEALRRFEKGWAPRVFVGICRNVEKR